MENNITPNDNQEVIAKKRVWTYPIIIFGLLFGFLMLFGAIFSLFLNKELLQPDTLVVLIFGFLVLSDSLYVFICKILTPKNVIIYNNKQKTLQITAFRKKREIFISEIIAVLNIINDMGIKISFYDKKPLLIWGVSKPYTVCQKIRNLLPEILQ